MNGPARWRPSPFVRASIAGHAVAVAVLLAAAVLAVRPGGAPVASGGAADATLAATLAWIALAAIVADHAVLSLAGMLPRSTLLGPNLRRVPAGSRRIVLTIDDGPDPAVTPQVLDVLARHGAHATFFVIGERACAHPELLARLLREGHSIGNHTQRHAHTFSLLGPRAVRRELHEAQQTLHALTGRTPRWFRAPAGIRNPFLDPALSRTGLTLVSWTRRGYDAVDGRRERVLHRLGGPGGAWLRDGDILLLHDGHAARDRDGHPVILTALPALLADCAARGLRVASLDEACPA